MKSEKGLIITLEALDNKRRDALSRGNAEDYCISCNESGIEPEFLELYEQGLAEKQYLQERKEERKLDKLNKYQTFLKYARPYHGKRLAESFKAKAEILSLCFGDKFGIAGMQPLYDLDGNPKYEPEGIGKIFNEVYSYAQKVLRDTP